MAGAPDGILLKLALMPPDPHLLRPWGSFKVQRQIPLFN